MAIFIKLSHTFLCLLFSLLTLSHKTMSQPRHMGTFCDDSSDKFTQNSPYKSNRETLLSSLRDRSSLGTYHNATVGLIPDKVHGMFLCRGDITKTSCSVCVKTATLEITINNNCTYLKNVVIYYDECMVRYSNTSFLSLQEDGPWVALYSNVSFPNSIFNSFQVTLSDKVEQLIVLTASKSSLSSTTPYYVKDKTHVTNFGIGSYTLETMVQCSPDLDPANCGVCLRLALQTSSFCCHNARVAQIFLLKCYLKYDTIGLPQSSSSSTNVMKGNEIFGRILITAMITSVLALVLGL